MSGRHMPPDRARDDIAGRKLGAGHVGHEAIAALVDEDRAFAAHRLADEFQRKGSAVERRRMELNEFEIGHDRAGARREREALAKGSGRIGAMQEQPADAAGRDDDAIGGEKHRPARRSGREHLSPHCLRRSGAARWSPRITVIEGVSQTLRARARMMSRPVASPPAWTIRRRECAASRPSAMLPLGIAIESHAEPHQLFDRGRRRGEDRGGDGLVAKPSPAVSVSARCSEASSSGPRLAAMPPWASTLDDFEAERRLGQEQHRLRRQRQRGHQAGEAAADDDGSAVGIVQRRHFTASIRSTARRARAAMPRRS